MMLIQCTLKKEKENTLKEVRSRLGCNKRCRTCSRLTVKSDGEN
jgi:bacterioferritin-associated ferredoxin